MSENTGQSKKVIVLLIVVLAAALAGWWFLSGETVSPPVGGVAPSATNAPPTPAANRIIGGEVLSIALSDQKIVVGAYRVESGKRVLDSQSTVYYTNATVFSREAKSQSGLPAEDRISPEDTKVGEVAMIVVSGARPADRLVAERVAFILPPPPPSRR